MGDLKLARKTLEASTKDLEQELEARMKARTALTLEGIGGPETIRVARPVRLKVQGTTLYTSDSSSSKR